MLDPNELASASEAPSFPMHFEKFLLDGKDVGPVEIQAHYNHEWRTVLNLSTILGANPKITLSASSKVDARLTDASEDIAVIVTKFSLGANGSVSCAEGRTTREPIVTGPAIGAQNFTAVLLSSPERYGKTISLEDRHSNTFEFRAPVGASNEKRVVAASIALDSSQPLAKLQTLLAFLTFLKGSHCGIGNLRATDQNGKPAFDLIGFTRNDNIQHQTNWFDIEIHDNLQEIFLLFSQAMETEPTQKALNQAIEFYRASHVSRASSLEMSIIAAHSGLEAVTNFILAYLAGWSSALLENRTIAFSDRLRAACGFFGLGGQILKDLPHLHKRSTARNNQDAFELVSLFRNKIVHQDSKFKADGVELHEAWTLAQWFLEVMIFGIIGYRGRIIDRRVYTGWRGTTCDVPLSR